MQTRKRFFEVYAKQNKFDPLIPENWYAQTQKQILSVKVFLLLNSKHNSTFIREGRACFPIITEVWHKHY
jgi:hypothetical protein